MAYNNGKEIERAPKRPWPAKSKIKVTTGGEERTVDIIQVSRQRMLNVSHREITASWVPGGTPDPWRAPRRERRKARMRLRKRRGWR